MLTTRFLSPTEYYRYGEWLKKQDADTRHLYFGIPMSDKGIDSLLKNVLDNKQEHYFLVAEEKSTIVGTIHIAIINGDEVEFGVIVDGNLRGQGIGNQLIGEAIIWARNRGYATLYMHCLSWNRPIRHLCTKHGLEVRSFPQDGEAETKVSLPPLDFATLTAEVITKNTNLYKRMLQRNPFFESVYG